MPPLYTRQDLERAYFTGVEDGRAEERHKRVAARRPTNKVARFHDGAADVLHCPCAAHEGRVS